MFDKWKGNKKPESGRYISFMITNIRTLQTKIRIMNLSTDFITNFDEFLRISTTFTILTNFYIFKVFYLRISMNFYEFLRILTNFYFSAETNVETHIDIET